MQILQCYLHQGPSRAFAQAISLAKRCWCSRTMCNSSQCKQRGAPFMCRQEHVAASVRKRLVANNFMSK